MARQIINVGTVANDGTGDGLRTAFTKSNENFQELYNTTITPIRIVNGTSNIAILEEDGNVTVTIGGIANTVVFSETIANISANLEVSGDITGAGNVTGNDFYVGDILTVSGTVGSDLVPDGNDTRSLGTVSSRWKDLFLTGSTLTLGGIVFKDNGSNVLGIFGPDGTTPATIQSSTIDTSIISNGTSNVHVVGTDGNVTISIDGTGNVLEVSSDTVTVAGNIDATNVNATEAVVGGNVTATGNVDAGNINVTHVTASGFFQGDGGLLSNVTAVSNVAATQLANGSSIISFAGSGGNIQFTVGSLQTANITTTGANINGYVDATGYLEIGSDANIAGNLDVGGFAAVVGNLDAGNIATTGDLSVLGNISGAGLELGTGTIVTTGNLSCGNVSTTDVDAGIILATTRLEATANTTSSDSSTGAFICLGGVGIAENLNVGAEATVTGNITAAAFIGDGSQLTGIDSTTISDGTSNVSVLSTDGNVAINVAGTEILSVTANGTSVSGSTSVSGNITVTETVTGASVVSTDTISATGNISGGNLSTAGIATVVGNITGGNIDTAGQISATGNVNGGNIMAPVGIANVALLRTQTATFSTLANVTGTTDAISSTSGSLRTAGGLGVVGNAYVGGLLDVSGTVSGASTIVATGNVSGGNITTAGIVEATGNVIGGNIVTSGAASVSEIIKTGSDGVGNIGQSDNSFDTVFAKATSAQYADLAEMYRADAEYAPGTVVVFGGISEITISDQHSDPCVAGVVSSAPAYLMNDSLDSEYTAPVALVGRVPTRVKGPIRKGQMLVSAPDGFAKATIKPELGTVIGKALESFSGAEGVIEVVIGRL